MKEYLKYASIISAIVFAIAGIMLLQIKTVSGTSVAEQYYHYVGIMSFGMGIFSSGILGALQCFLPEPIVVKETSSED